MLVLFIVISICHHKQLTSFLNDLQLRRTPTINLLPCAEVRSRYPGVGVTGKHQTCAVYCQVLESTNTPIF